MDFSGLVLGKESGFDPKKDPLSEPVELVFLGWKSHTLSTSLWHNRHITASLSD